MPKKKTKSPKRTSKHESFKLTPHNHPTHRVVLYFIIALAVGIVLSYFLQDKTLEVLGVNTY